MGSDGSQYVVMKYVGAETVRKTVAGDSAPQDGDRLRITYSETDTVTLELKRAGETTFSTILTVSDADDSGTPADLQNAGDMGLFFRDTTARIGQLVVRTLAAPLTGDTIYPSGYAGGEIVPDYSAYPLDTNVFKDTCTLPTMTFEAPIGGEVSSTDGTSTAGTNSLYHCIGIIMFGTNPAGDVVFNVHHYNESQTEEILLAQRQRLIDLGAVPATIETYATSGGTYAANPPASTVVQYGAELNLKSVAYDLFAGDDEFWDVIDITATPDKEIYIRKRTCGP